MNIPNSVIEDAKEAGFSDVFVSDYGRVFAKFAELTLARNVPKVNNQNDLVMIRRGDVEALKQEAIFGVFRRDAVEWDKLNALLANAPVVSGEAVAYTDGKEDFMSVATYEEYKKLGFFTKCTQPLYTTPQQAPSADDVRDAERYRWLVADHDNKDTRQKCRDLISRLGVMSYSAASSEIDQAIAQEVK